jgi:TRAP-type C4-dicarboxylate transport system permease small subunit
MDTFTSWIGMVFLSLMFVILLLQVFFRYVLNNSLPWPEEIAVVLLVWSAFIGASIALKNRLHVSIVVFIDMLPKKIKPFSLLVVDLLVGLFSGYLMIYGWAIAEFVGARQKTPFTDIPYFYLYLSVAAGGLLLLIHALVLIVDDLVSVLGIEK